MWFGSLGPIQPMLEGEPTAAALTAARFAGGPFMFMAFTLFVVRWNTINGKAGAIGCTVRCALGERSFAERARTLSDARARACVCARVSYVHPPYR
jgi:hypothetical protein